MVEDGLSRARRDLETSKQRGAFGGASAPNALIRHYIEPLSELIANFLFESVGKRGPQPPLYTLCGHLEARALAYIAMTSVMSLFDESTAKVFITAGARAMGRAIEYELLLEAFKKAHPDQFDIVQKAISKRGLGTTRALDQWKMNAKERGLEFRWWTSDDALRVGLVLLDMIIQGTSLLEVTMENGQGGGRRHSRHNQRHIQLSPDAHAWILKRTELIGMLRPAYLPAVEPPTPWVSTRGGGYPVEGTSKARLVKEPPYKCGLRGAESQDQAKLEPVLKSVNAIQGTPWEINSDVLKVVQQAWENNLVVGSLPMQEDQEIPPRPLDYEDNTEAAHEWRRVARFIHTQNKVTLNQRVNTQRLISTATEFTQAPALYFPQVLDFRSRSYPASTLISPQGSDLSRGILRFKESGPHTSDAWVWSNIHGANCFGVDKVSFEDRLEWVRVNSERIKATKDNPFGDLWWTEADSPWCFLAWCFEYASDTDLGYKIPVALDGSCNGLQHLSAILRDPVGGAAVNLLPSPKPNDIYAQVAEATVKRLIQAAIAEEPHAATWTTFGITRKETKRPVMVLPYGGTQFSCLEYTRDAIRERIKDGHENPFGDDLGKACGTLSRTIWEAIGDVVIAAKEVMAWLRDVARIAGAEQKPLIWTTPAGFVVHQSYQSVKRRQVKCLTLGKAVWLEEYNRLDEIDTAKQVNAFPPNFIHSMDAAALHLTVGRAEAAGIKNFHMIHDSFGTHPHLTGEFRGIIRDTFADMYLNQGDVLANLRGELQERTGLALPEPPKMLGLDLNEVRKSDYFFA